MILHYFPWFQEFLLPLSRLFCSEFKAILLIFSPFCEYLSQIVFIYRIFSLILGFFVITTCKTFACKKKEMLLIFTPFWAKLCSFSGFCFWRCESHPCGTAYATIREMLFTAPACSGWLCVGRNNMLNLLPHTTR